MRIDPSSAARAVHHRPRGPQLGSRLRQRWATAGARGWVQYLAGRLAAAFVLTVLVVVLTFLLVHLVPGDPGRNMLGLSATPREVEHQDEQLGLTEPLPQQFVRYVGNLLHGDLGESFDTRQPVSQLIAQRLPVTAELAGLGILIMLVVGFPAGITMAALEERVRARWIGVLFTGGASLAGALPEYITGTILILVVGLTLHLLPVQGGMAPNAIILPAACVSFAATAVFARLVRNETSTILKQEYIMTARSKRLPAWRLYVHHVLPNAVTSALTLGGLILVALLGGTVIAENVFNIAGLGSEIVLSIQHNDYPATQGVILVLGLLAIGINLGIDIVLGIADPRTLTSRGGS